jgi:hypothetical protein
MSIVALKRKTAAQYNSLSVGHTGFSINGSLRNQGYIGQDSRGRALARTLMNGATARGYGGCCGKYHETGIVRPADTMCLNDPNVVKPSVLGSYGRTATRDRWITRPAPFATVKLDYAKVMRTQSDYIERLRKLSIIEAGKSSCPNTYVPAVCNNEVLKAAMKTSYLRRKICTDTKDLEADAYVAKSHEMYLLGLDSSCNLISLSPNKIMKPMLNVPVV